MPIKDIKPNETEYEAFVRHKQQIESLATFGKKLTYWLSYIDNFPSITEKVVNDKVKGKITLGLELNSYEDRALFFESVMNYYRNDYFSLNEIDYKEKFIQKLEYIGSTNEQRIGFSIKPYDYLVEDFTTRYNSLPFLASKKRLIQNELDSISKKLSKYSYPKELDELRYCFITGRKYDFTFHNEESPTSKACILAEIWDVTRFETYLLIKKDSLEELIQTTLDTTNSIVNDFNTDTEKPILRAFPELLADGYTEKDLCSLLVHIQMKKIDGQSIWSQNKKAGLWGVIDALEFKKLIIKTSRIELMASLSNYLGLKDSRIKDGYSSIQSKIKEKSLSFLNQQYKDRK
jgi:hypothetical protein